MGELALEVRLLRVERAHQVLPVGRRVEHLVVLVILADRADELAGEVVDQLLARVHVRVPSDQGWVRRSVRAGERNVQFKGAEV